MKKVVNCNNSFSRSLKKKSFSRSGRFGWFGFQSFSKINFISFGNPKFKIFNTVKSKWKEEYFWNHGQHVLVLFSRFHLVSGPCWESRHTIECLNREKKKKKSVTNDKRHDFPSSIHELFLIFIKWIDRIRTTAIDGGVGFLILIRLHCLNLKRLSFHGFFKLCVIIVILLTSLCLRLKMTLFFISSIALSSSYIGVDPEYGIVGIWKR